MNATVFAAHAGAVEHEAMLDLIAVTGRGTRVDVFDRFAVAKAGTSRSPLSAPETFVTEDGR